MSIDALEQNILLQPRPPLVPRPAALASTRKIALPGLADAAAGSKQRCPIRRDAAMYTVYYYPANASAVPRMLLEALGAAIFSHDQSAGNVQ